MSDINDRIDEFNFQCYSDEVIHTCINQLSNGVISNFELVLTGEEAKQLVNTMNQHPYLKYAIAKQSGIVELNTHLFKITSV